MKASTADIGAKLRKARGLRTLDQIVAETGIPKSTLHKIEAGAVETRLATIATLCEFYQISLDELVGLKAPPHRKTSVASVQRLLEQALERIKKIEG